MVGPGMVRRLFILLLVLGVGAAAGAGWLVVHRGAGPTNRRSRCSAGVVGTAEDGWQQLAYQEFRLEVPPDWDRLERPAAASSSPSTRGPDRSRAVQRMP